MTTTEERPAVLLPEGKTGALHVMAPEGDINIFWDKDNPADVAVAKAAWDKAKSEHRMLGYRVEGDEGRRGEVMREFDPAAERLILRPQLQGG